MSEHPTATPGQPVAGSASAPHVDSSAGSASAPRVDPSAVAGTVAAQMSERPEIAIGGAFAGGLVLALILKRLAR